MEIIYDNHENDYKSFINDEKKFNVASSWINNHSLDYWRHNRMLEPIRIFLDKSDKWLTIGDGRFGAESNWLKNKGVKSHASDMNIDFLELALEKGYIDSYSKENAEKLSFESNSFDYVLIKETFHHLPRPWLALYEAFRVCRKAVIVIEPNDPYINVNFFSKIFLLLKNFIKLLLKKRIFKDEYNFEEVGNFIYSINFREFEKFLLGMHKNSIGFFNVNDHYINNIENIPQKPNTFKEKLICIRLKTIIILKNLLSKFGIIKYSIGEVILFKNSPGIETIEKMRKCNWQYKELPRNPFFKK